MNPCPFVCFEPLLSDRLRCVPTIDYERIDVGHGKRRDSTVRSVGRLDSLCGRVDQVAQDPTVALVELIGNIKVPWLVEAGVPPIAQASGLDGVRLLLRKSGNVFLQTV